MNNLLRLLLKKHLWKYKKIIENMAEPSALACRRRSEFFKTYDIIKII